MSGKKLYLNKMHIGRIEIQSYLCLVLVCLIVMIFSFSGCGVNKEYKVTDLKLEDRSVNVQPISSGTKFDLDNGELTLLHEYENEKVSLYYYESYKQALGKEIHIEEVILKQDDNYSVFLLPIDADYIGSDENKYEAYDYDNDGSVEFAVLLSLISDKDDPDKKLFIFDYNEDREKFYVTYLGIPNLHDVIDECVVKYYEDNYSIKYEPKGFYGGSGQDEGAIRYYALMDGYNRLEYGDCMEAAFLKDGGIEIEVMISGNLNNSNGGYEETGVVVCEVQYLDMGKFTVNASIYKEKL